jgi:hypothetical protein
MLERWRLFWRVYSGYLGGMDEGPRERFGEALEKKKEDSRRRSQQGRDEPPEKSAIEGDQRSLAEHGRTQDVRDERKKNTGHGKKTADKWNQ